jgi:hypothetical protein
VVVGIGLLAWKAWDAYNTAKDIADNPHDIGNYVGIIPGGKLLKRMACGYPRGGRPGSGLPGKGGPPGDHLVHEKPSGGGTIRIYDENGNARTDYDFGHDHGIGDPHAHDFEIGPNGKPLRGRGRQIRPGDTY